MLHRTDPLFCFSSHSGQFSLFLWHGVPGLDFLLEAWVSGLVS